VFEIRFVKLITGFDTDDCTSLVSEASEVQ
jgi:hypothetical protein